MRKEFDQIMLREKGGRVAVGLWRECLILAQNYVRLHVCPPAACRTPFQPSAMPCTK